MLRLKSFFSVLYCTFSFLLIRTSRLITMAVFFGSSLSGLIADVPVFQSDFITVSFVFMNSSAAQSAVALSRRIIRYGRHV
jgi:hypothetical protein